MFAELIRYCSQLFASSSVDLEVLQFLRCVCLRQTSNINIVNETIIKILLLGSIKSPYSEDKKFMRDLYCPFIHDKELKSSPRVRINIILVLH